MSGGNYSEVIAELLRANVRAQRRRRRSCETKWETFILRCEVKHESHDRS